MLARLAEKGKISAEEAEAATARLETVDALDGLAPAELVIEAAPERLDLKLDLLTQLAAVVDPACVLATNTSSLSVTELAAATPGSERVVGMHFFPNPAPVMKLVEVVAGEGSGEEPLAAARALGEAMGKHVIDAADVAGFLVNRCNRPYSLESLKLLEERIADVETIDRIERTAGGFRMGAFELMDLIGIEQRTMLGAAEMLYSAVLRRAPLSALAPPGPQDRGWRARAEDGARLVRLLGGRRPPRRRPGGPRAGGR